MLEAEAASSWADEEDQISREKLQMIKAHTMYEMVEEIELPGAPCNWYDLAQARLFFETTTTFLLNF